MLKLYDYPIARSARRCVVLAEKDLEYERSSSTAKAGAEAA
jgi:hypothetical protein